MEKKRFNSIDLCKLIMAICVVAIHTRPFDKCEISLVNNIYDSFVGIAVPFFFIATGFLLGNKIENIYDMKNNNFIIEKYMVKIVKMYIIWTAIYLPMAIYYYIASGTKPIKAVLSYIRGFVFIGEQYNSWPLWYLLSTIYALLFIMLMVRHNVNIKIILCAAFVFFIVSVVLNYLSLYEGTLAVPFYIIQKLLNMRILNGRILTGLFYIPLGIYFSKKKLPVCLSWFLMIGGYVANIVIDSSSVSSFMLAASAIGFFEIIKDINLPDSSFYQTVRKMSTVIYFIHMYVWSFYYKFVYTEKTYGLDCFVVTVCSCVIIALIYVKIMSSRYYRNRIADLGGYA